MPQPNGKQRLVFPGESGSGQQKQYAKRQLHVPPNAVPKMCWMSMSPTGRDTSQAKLAAGPQLFEFVIEVYAFSWSRTWFCRSPVNAFQNSWELGTSTHAGSSPKSYFCLSTHAGSFLGVGRTRRRAGTSCRVYLPDSYLTRFSSPQNDPTRSCSFLQALPDALAIPHKCISQVSGMTGITLSKLS